MPSAVEIDAAFGSSLRNPAPLEIAWLCQPEWERTMSPGAYSVLRDLTTRATVPPSITPSISTG